VSQHEGLRDFRREEKARKPYEFLRARESSVSPGFGRLSIGEGK